jgi:O-6-methylguanine DNA methyltransferase
MIFLTEFQKRVYLVRKFKKRALSVKREKSKFSNGVYEIVKKIPRGGVLSYQEVAYKLGKPGAARAVGNALNRNFDKRIPCHRVIKSSGFVGGYRSGTKKKIEILRREGIKIINSKIQAPNNK